MPSSVPPTRSFGSRTLHPGAARAESCGVLIPGVAAEAKRSPLVGWTIEGEREVGQW